MAIIYSEQKEFTLKFRLVNCALELEEVSYMLKTLLINMLTLNFKKYNYLLIKVLLILKISQMLKKLNCLLKVNILDFKFCIERSSSSSNVAASLRRSITLGSPNKLGNFGSPNRRNTIFKLLE